MRIGVISDTHGSLQAWQRAMERCFGGADLIVHAGDICYHGVRNPMPAGYEPLRLAEALNGCPVPLLVCRGNCDSEVDQLAIDLPILSPCLLLELEGVRVLVHHGHRFSEEEVERLVGRWGLGVVISGHTHVPRLERRGKVLLFNPGSPALPKGEEGPTVGTLEVSRGRVVARLHELEGGSVLRELA